MKKLRLGIIGMGNIGRFHAGYVREGKVARCELTAVCARRLETLADFNRAAQFSDPETMMRSGLVDAVLIATPHTEHVPLSLAALAAGLHVMVEKPIAVHKAEAERLLTAHGARAGLVLGAMFQFRAQPYFQKMRELIQSGDLGSLVRVIWLNTDWFRPEAYYRSSAWRATWKGEGGGVLINQCLHNLDMLQWLVGQPARVHGFCQLGRFHEIEVEDDVTAYLEWANRATGTFVSCTGEAPGTNRLEIAGTRGRLLLENGRLTLTRNRTDAVELSRQSREAFAKPEFTTEELPLVSEPQPHAVLLQNFVNAILDGERLLVPGADGLASVELANAILYSSLIGRTVELPLDSAAWAAKLNELIANSQMTKKVVRPASADVASSFQR